MSGDEREHQNNREEARDIRREESEIASEGRSTTSDAVLLKEMFKIHDTLADIQKQYVDYAMLKRDVARHEALLCGDPEEMGKSGIVATLSRFKAEYDQRLKDIMTASSGRAAWISGIIAALGCIGTWLAIKK